MTSPAFWQDLERVKHTTREFEKNKKLITELTELDSKLTSLSNVIRHEDFSHTDEAAISLLSELADRLNKLEVETILNGPHDKADAHIFLHSGAGGVDAADWTEMLMNMYLKYAEAKGWQSSIIDKTMGSEAGVKSATIRIEGDTAYGLLKAEKGVHRLVRLSPFNAQNLRQTSFALVEVIPDLGDIAEIELDEKDLRIDVFHSSGKGGQSVNTTDSAVRITHLPTKLSVSVQNERSQTQNKATAMKLLQHKLYLMKQEAQEEQERNLKGSDKSGDFGHQIRSYVLHPYQQVKDHRSGLTITQVQDVLNGKLLDELINSVLLMDK